MRQFLKFVPWKCLTKVILIALIIFPVTYFATGFFFFNNNNNNNNNNLKLGTTKREVHLKVFNRLENVEKTENENRVALQMGVENKFIKNRSKTFFNSGPKVIRFGRCQSKLTLSVVVCGDRRAMTLVTLKSALSLSLSSIHFAIVADDENRQPLAEEILDFPGSMLKRLSFEIHPITFPRSAIASEWKKLFKLCASQRLFLPSLLRDIDSLIYCDTDVIFLRPPDDLWDYFGKMNSSQMSGLSPEHEDYSTGWYNRFAKHPFYKPLGLNSGVMLMNLTRMRKFQWESYLEPILTEYKSQIVWGDQDIINIIFHYHSDKLLLFDCSWNFRPDHCMYSPVCKSAQKKGVAILHGNRGVFLNGKQPVFAAIYAAFQSYEMGSDLERHLLNPLKTSLESTTKTNCGRDPSSFDRQLRATIQRLKNHRFISVCNESPVWGQSSR